MESLDCIRDMNTLVSAYISRTTFIPWQVDFLEDVLVYSVPVNADLDSDNSLTGYRLERYQKANSLRII